MNLLITSLDETRVRQASRIRFEHGLLTIDSMLVAAAREYGISSIASNDTDFDKITDLTVYKPADVN
jgi:predicted nucleic acid-binding protein